MDSYLLPDSINRLDPSTTSFHDLVEKRTLVVIHEPHSSVWWRPTSIVTAR